MAVSDSDHSRSQNETDTKHSKRYVTDHPVHRSSSTTSCVVSTADRSVYPLDRFTSLFAKEKPSVPQRSVNNDAALIPEATAGWFSLVTFRWMTPLLSLGYARPLEASDLYKLQDNRSAAYIADKINASYDARKKKADAYNVRLANGEINPGWRAFWWSIRGNRKDRERKWREATGRKKASLTYAMNDSVKWWFWSAGILKLIGDTAQVTSPLLVKVCMPFAGSVWRMKLTCNRPLLPLLPSRSTNTAHLH